MNAGLFIAPDLAGDPALPALAERLAARGAVCATLAEAPRPRALLLACRAHGVDAPHAWLAARDPAVIAAAGTAGFAGVVLVGSDPPPGEAQLVVARAADLLDVPRAMVPRGGGCWHDLRQG